MGDDRSSPSEHYFALPPGTKLFEFAIEAMLGHGGFGITYKATDTLLEETVAIKEFLPNDLAIRVSDASVRAKSNAHREDYAAGLKAFLEEARLIARFRHPNIIGVRRFFELNGTGYIVFNYETGETLSQRLARGPLGEAELRQVLSGVLDGLEAVHAQAILHRDLKPNNVMLRADGTPVLIDFGAARDFKARHSRSVTAIAAPGYSPPEQYGVGGQQGPWTDLYALGAIAYRCVTGEAPPDSLRRLRADPLIPAVKAAQGKYDAALLATIDWMLAIEEEGRPATEAAVRAALEGGEIQQSSAARVSAAPRAAPKPKGGRLRRGVAGASALGLLAMVGVGVSQLAPLRSIACARAHLLCPEQPVVVAETKPAVSPSAQSAPTQVTANDSAAPSRGAPATESVAGTPAPTPAPNAPVATPPTPQPAAAPASETAATTAESQHPTATAPASPAAPAQSTPTAEANASTPAATIVTAEAPASARAPPLSPQDATPAPRSGPQAAREEKKPTVPAESEAKPPAEPSSEAAAAPPTSSTPQKPEEAQPTTPATATPSPAASAPLAAAPAAGDATPPLATTTSAAQMPAPPATLSEVERAWALVKDATDVRDVEAFRQQYGPSNPLYDRLAEKRIEDLRNKIADVGPAASAAGAAAALPSTPSPGATVPSPAPDDVAWGRLKDSKDPEQVRQFSAQFPASPHQAEANARLAALEPKVTDCDLLAAHREDPRKAAAVPGVLWQLIDAPNAKEACERAVQEFPDALRLQFQLGRVYEKAENYNEGRRFYEKAADLGYTAAMSALGALYEGGKGVSQDLGEARRLYLKAAELGSSDAMDHLAQLYEAGLGLPQDYNEARRWYTKAADLGNARATYDLGTLYREGHGVAQDYGEVLRWYRKAADLGNPAATNDLGWLYSNGKGVPKDYGEAIRWYTKAADLGVCLAMENLAEIYNNGEGVPRDYGEERRWLTKGANCGYYVAMYALGELYDTGRGVPRDSVEARKWYEKAANIGDASAMGNLGVIYARGEGVPRDYAEARRWFAKAADRGNATGMYNLGIMYRDGNGVPRDYGEARRWFEKAAELGYDNAKKELARLKR